MPYAIQYSQDSGTTFQQFGITTADITTASGNLCSFFYIIKDSMDNTYLLGLTSGAGWDDGIPFIKIDKNGVKTVTKVSSYNGECRNHSTIMLSLTRDETHVFINPSNSGTPNLKSLKTDMTTTTIRNTPILANVPKFALYQDRYIWVASGSTVKIYNYETKAELASHPFVDISSNLVITEDNICYQITYYNTVNGNIWLCKYSFNGINIITGTAILIDGSSNSILKGTKQIIIDKWGDLIIITNNGTTSTLLKYSTAGVKIGDTITLSGAMYNLNTDKDGNYYYSNALGTYKVPKNTAQGQAIAPLNQHVKIRDNGMTTFGNNISGYNPAVFA